jgi:TRAP-type transport system small permease protein
VIHEASPLPARGPSGGLTRIATGVRDGIDRLSYVAIVALMGVMTTIISTQVGLRYIFNSSIDWADELSRLSFVWVVFLAVPHGVKQGLHVGLDLVPGLLPTRLRRWSGNINRVIMAAFLVTAGWQAARLAVRNWGNEMPTLGLSSGLFFVALALCCAHSLLHLATGVPASAPVEHRADVA